MKFFLTFLLAMTSLNAAVQDHFKPAPDKGNNHGLTNIDFIYMINLDQRPEKFAASYAQLEPYGIHPYRFSAVNGWELTLAQINDVGVQFRPGLTRIMATTYVDDVSNPIHELIHRPGRTYFCHCMARGPIGICLSHLSVLQDAYDSGYEIVWVMEDDIELIRSPLLLPELIAKLDARVGRHGWDILFTDQDTKNDLGVHVPATAGATRPNFRGKSPQAYRTRRDFDRDFRSIGARYGAYSYIINRAGMKKVLDHIKTHKIFLPYDMDIYMRDDVRMFNLRLDVVSTKPGSISDNGAPRYLNKEI